MPLPLYFYCFLSSASPLFFSSSFVPPSLFLCGPPWFCSLRLLCCLCLVLPHPLLSLLLSTASLCSKYFLPPPLSSFHSFLCTPCPVAISCKRFCSSPFSFLYLQYLFALISFGCSVHTVTYSQFAHILHHAPDTTKPLPLLCISLVVGTTSVYLMFRGTQSAHGSVLPQ